MKKLLLLLAVLPLFMMSGCQKTTPFSLYHFLVPSESWSGGVNETHERVAHYLIRNGFVVHNLVIEGADATTNDVGGIAVYESKIKQLKDNLSVIGKELAGIEGTPCTVRFDYNMYNGSSISLMKYTPIVLDIPGKD